MSRDSMVWLIAFLRTKVNDTGLSIWLDDELQNYLDMHRIHLVKEPLAYDPSAKIYRSGYGMLEADSSLWDSNLPGAIEINNSKYTANLIDGTFGFEISQDCTYYLDAKSYDIHGAIAECLEQLAMDQNRAKTWNRGSVSYTHYDLMEMAQYHRNLTGMKSIGCLRIYNKR